MTGVRADSAYEPIRHLAGRVGTRITLPYSSCLQNVLESPLDRAVAAMRGFGAPWAIAGDWAIELYLGNPIRPHADVDVAILRADQRRLWTDLHPRAAKQIVGGVTRVWSSDQQLDPPIHELHVTTADGYYLEVLLNEHDPETGDWIYRRDPRVRRALSRTFVEAQTIPVLAPEIALLYKSKARRAHDEADFAAALPHRQGEQRDWLRTTLETTAPGHQWAGIVTRQP